MLPQDKAGLWCVFVNLDEIAFPVAQEPWGAVLPAPDTSSPVHLLAAKRAIIGAGKYAIFQRGKICFDVNMVCA